MKAYRVVFGMAVALAIVGLIAAAGVAEDKASDKDKDKKKVGGRTYLGKIDRVDADKRMLFLADVRGQGDTGKKERAAKDREAMAFTVSSTAPVTLDGRKATLGDLKAGHYARVHAGVATADKGGDTSKDREKKKEGKERDLRDRGPIAERIEAFTKEPRGKDKE